VLLAGVLMIVTAAAVFLSHGRALLPADMGAWAYFYRAALGGVTAAYFVVNWTHSGQTLGMRAWHLRAVSAVGKPLNARTALLRFVLAVLAWAPAALGVLWLYLDTEHLALHDRLSKTRLIHLSRS
jgi:uncharacterized RDD family membrane protein YckC